jgi:Rad4 beta-hairpin domain 1/Rad4 beta-hairpin domain 3
LLSSSSEILTFVSSLLFYFQVMIPSFYFLQKSHFANGCKFDHRGLDCTQSTTMSFDWNLSSDEETEDVWKEGKGYASVAADPNSGENGEARAEWLSNEAGNNENEFEQDSNDDDSVDWEDAEDGSVDEDEKKRENVSDDDRKPAARITPLQPITLTLDSSEEAPTRKKAARVRRSKWRYEQLPPNLQDTVRNVNQTHLLVLISRAAHASRLSCDAELLSLCLSVIPRVHADASRKNVHKSNEACWYAPAISDVEFMLEWFMLWMPSGRQKSSMSGSKRKRNGRGRGRYRRIKPDSSPEVVQLNDGVDVLPSLERLKVCMRRRSKEKWSSNETCLLFLAMTRALQYRVRYVQAMDGVPLDLEVDHPILQHWGNVFRTVSAGTSRCMPTTPEMMGEDIKSEMKSGYTVTSAQSSVQAASQQPLMGWVEVLCQVQGKMRWVHVDPVRRVMNKPSQVEVWWACSMKDDADCDARKSAMARKRSSTLSVKPGVLSYALAVEHAAFASHSGDNNTDDDGDDVPVRYMDVTPRYAHSWVSTLRRRGVLRGKRDVTPAELQEQWWAKTISKLNSKSGCDDSNETLAAKVDKSGGSAEDAIMLDESDDDGVRGQEEEVDESDERKPAAKTDVNDGDKLFAAAAEYHEEEELKATMKDEAIPTSKAAFRTHPIYVLPSLLNKAEVLAPDAKFCGVCKGEFVYRRSDVSVARPARKWLYHGRRVREAEMDKPVQRVKARQKSLPKSFKALKSYGVGATNDGSEEARDEIIAQANKPLEDDMERLYAVWQTDAWSPAYVGPNDEIPVNEYKNVELELLNPGLVHVEERGVALTAKTLGIAYAPCLLGFEGRHGNRTPTIRGIVVHAHNEALLRDAHAAVMLQQEQDEEEDRRSAALQRWRRLMLGLLNKARIDREYGQSKDD